MSESYVCDQHQGCHIVEADVVNVDDKQYNLIVEW